MDNEKIINALKVIHDECDTHVDCEKCPFGDKNSRCQIANVVPSNWNINEETDVWRALK